MGGGTELKNQKSKIKNKPLKMRGFFDWFVNDPDLIGRIYESINPVDTLLGREDVDLGSK